MMSVCELDEELSEESENTGLPAASRIGHFNGSNRVRTWGTRERERCYRVFVDGEVERG